MLANIKRYLVEVLIANNESTPVSVLIASGTENPRRSFEYRVA